MDLHIVSVMSSGEFWLVRWERRRDAINQRLLSRLSGMWLVNLFLLPLKCIYYYLSLLKTHCTLDLQLISLSVSSPFALFLLAQLSFQRPFCIKQEWINNAHLTRDFCFLLYFFFLLVFLNFFDSISPTTMQYLKVHVTLGILYLTIDVLCWV